MTKVRLILFLHPTHLQCNSKSALSAKSKSKQKEIRNLTHHFCTKITHDSLENFNILVERLRP